MITPIQLGTTGPGERTPLLCHLVQTDDANILVNTGIGTGDDDVQRRHEPDVIDIESALHAASGLGVDQIDIVINTSLLPGHCGNNPVFHRPPVYVQTAEYDIAMSGSYTPMAWFNPMVVHYQQLTGDYQVTDHVRVLATPGFTPGQQSVLVDTGDGSELIVGLAVFDAEEFGQLLSQPLPRREAHDEAQYLASAKRLLEFDVTRVHFTHSSVPWEK